MSVWGTISGGAKKIGKGALKAAGNTVKSGYDMGVGAVTGDMDQFKEGALNFGTAGTYGIGKDVAKGTQGALSGDWQKAMEGFGDLGVFGVGSQLGGALDIAKGGVQAGKEAAGALGDALGGAADWYNDGYNQAKDANIQAGKDLRQIGTEGREYLEGGLGRALGEMDFGKQAYERAYGEGGSLSGPSILEQRYKQVSSGDDPVAAHQLQRGTENFMNEYAAKAGLNSGAAAKALARMGADVTADAARRADTLAGQASAEQTGRAKGGLEAALGIGRERAGLITDTYGRAGDIDNQGKIAGVNANLAASSIDLAKRKDLMNLGGQALGGITGLVGALI